MNTSNLTVSREIFDLHPQVSQWRFEVTYWSSGVDSRSSFDMIINQVPQGGSCTIDPLNGTIETIFTVSCTNWTDSDGIRSYSLYSRCL